MSKARDLFCQILVIRVLAKTEVHAKMTTETPNVSVQMISQEIRAKSHQQVDLAFSYS